MNAKNASNSPLKNDNDSDIDTVEQRSNANVNSQRNSKSNAKISNINPNAIINQGNFGTCWFVSSIHSLVASPAIRELLNKYVASIKNMITPNSLANGGGLSYLLKHAFALKPDYKNETRTTQYDPTLNPADIKDVKIFDYLVGVYELFEKNSSLDSCPSPNNIVDMLKYLIKTKSKNTFISNVRAKRGDLSKELNKQLQLNQTTKQITVELWRYTGTSHLSTSMINEGAVAHKVIFPFLVYLLDYKRCLTVHVTKEGKQRLNEDELKTCLSILADFVSSKAFTDFFDKPEIISVTCDLDNDNNILIPVEVKNYQVQSGVIHIEDENGKEKHAMAIINDPQRASPYVAYNSWEDNRSGIYEFDWRKSANFQPLKDYRNMIFGARRHEKHTLNYVISSNKAVIGGKVKPKRKVTKKVNKSIKKK